MEYIIIIIIIINIGAAGHCNKLRLLKLFNMPLN